MNANKSADRILIIGFGSTLRGDDAVGRLVSETIADKELPNVVALSLTQLVPELVTLVVSARAVIFVDASVADQEEVEIREILPACPLSRRFHDTGPRELLALTRHCYGRSPLAWLVTIPTRNMRISDELSGAARRHVAEATCEIQRLIQRLAIRETSHA
jgi:hydrogenase maturation protease